MNSRQLKSLVKAMKSQGVVHLKAKGIEISLETSNKAQSTREEVPPERTILPTAPEVTGPLAAAEAAAIRVKVENVKSIMSTSDDELADMLFPVGKENPTIEDYPEND